MIFWNSKCLNGEGFLNSMNNITSDNVRRLYDETGWVEDGGVTFDAAEWEDLRPEAAEYVSACRMRTKRNLPASGHRLIDMASGPIQYPEYLTFSDGFDIRTCIDLSQRALDGAREKLGDRGEYLCGDFLELDVPEADAAISLHTIYHIDADRQEAAVRKLICSVKRGAPVVIVYANPGYPPTAVKRVARRLFNAGRKLFTEKEAIIYYHSFPLSWWKRFEDEAEVQILPWRALPVHHQKYFGGAVLKRLYQLEERFPRFFAKWGHYPMIVLTRR